MRDLFALYLGFDGRIPDRMEHVLSSGGYQHYLKRIASQAERQFSDLVHLTQNSIAQARRNNETPDDLVQDLRYYRDRAVESRILIKG